MANYAEFLATKRLVAPSCGREVSEDEINPALFPFQRALVRWAVRKGRCAIFAGTGLGKTRMQLEWARLVGERTLILAPLTVAGQTVREGEQIGIAVTYARSQEQASDGITITNYEMLDRFDPAAFGAVVLDESSILKSFSGVTKNALIEAFRSTPYRLCCTATPAPNDIAEIANHSEFLSVMTSQEMIANWFINRSAGKDLQLKRHGRESFFRWLASWAISLNRPSDLGFSDAGYDLPPFTVEPIFVDTDYVPEGRLFALGLNGVTERAQVRRDTLEARVEIAINLIADEWPEVPWIVWYGLLDEGRAVASRLHESGSVLIEGSLPSEQKEIRLASFLNGERRILVTHASIGGFGLNLQHCARMVFVGLGDSFEQYYQCIRRCWRFGQRQPVTAYVVLSEPERVIWENVRRKEAEAARMSEEMLHHVAEFERAEIDAAEAFDDYQPSREMSLPAWLS